MIKLSDRLQTIADYVHKGESVADIGTDHGFLPISLIEKDISPKVILCDVNVGPLEKAKENIAKNLPNRDFDLRIGDGLEKVKPFEVDDIVIAGMGGLLIADIIGADLEKSKSFKKFILQPRNAQDKLRQWLITNGFKIIDEALVREGKYICEIIVAASDKENTNITSEARENKTNIDFEISHVLFEKHDPLLVEFIQNKIRIENKIYKEIKARANKEKDPMLKKTEERMELLKELLERSVKIES